MMRRALAPIVLLIAVIGALGWRTRSPDAALEFYAPEAYVQRADHLIRQGLLEADCSSEPIRIRVDPGRVSEADRIWYANSYLQGDVERFNSDPQTHGWTFLIDDACILLGVNPVVHTIQLPFIDRRRWLGNIFFRGRGADVTLRSSDRLLALRHPLERVSVDDTVTATVGRGRTVSGEVITLHFGGGRERPAGRLHHVGQEVVIHNQIRSRGEGEIRLLGHPMPAGRTARLETADWLQLSSPERQREETFIFSAGEVRDVASVVRQRNDRFERSTDDEPLGWIDDARGDQPQKMLEGLVASLHSALQIVPEERGRALEQAFDLQLTVDRELQAEVDQALRQFSQQQQRQRGLDSVFSAGVTVLDGKSGDLLALATYPHPEDLEAAPPADPRRRRRLLMNQNFVRHPIGSAGKPFFFAAVAEAHPAFLRLVLDAHPEEERRQELLQCRLKFGYQVLGSGVEVDFERALEVSSNRYTVELAILALAADSTARSASIEALLRRDSEVAWPPAEPGSGLRLGDQPLRFAPDFSHYMHRRDDLQGGLETTAVEACLALDRLDQLAFRRPFETLTGVSTYRGEDPAQLPAEIPSGLFYSSYNTQRYDLGPFRPVLDFLSRDAAPEVAISLRAALQTVAPERVNLAFNHVSDLRLDFVSMLLGGGNSTWTNIQLAESLSRLITGRPVEARLVSQVLRRDQVAGDGVPGESTASEAPAPESTPGATDGAGSTAADETSLGDPLPFKPRVRRAVLRGMEKVVTGDSGTATALREELRALRDEHPDRDVRLYSKTGSPTILIPVPRRTAEALRQLLRQGLLVFDGRTVAIADGTTRTAHRPPGSSARSTFVDAVAAAVARVERRSPRLQRAILGLLDEFQADFANLTFPAAASRPETIPGPLFALGRQLQLNNADPLFTQNLLRERGSVYIFSLVSMPRGRVAAADAPSRDVLDDPETRVISGALHLDLGPDSAVAVAATEALLPKLSGWLDPRP